MRRTSETDGAGGGTRWGVAATGGIATQFVAGMRDVAGGEVVAVASRSAERAAAFAASAGVARAHGSYAALAADPEVDVVYVATPHAQHAPVAIAMLEAGKHVLCEKPLALDAARAGAMVDAARASGRFLMEAMWSRFLPAYRLLREALDAGAIGTPLVVQADFGFRVPVVAEHRLFAPALGGGSLLDVGVYPLQLCSLVFGAPDAVHAVAHVGETGVDERLAAVLHHPGGGIGVVASAIRADLACRARISGSDGAIELPALAHCPQRLRVNGEWVDAAWEGEGLRFQAEEVQRCLAAGLVESPVMPWAESLQLAATMDAVRSQVGVAYPAS